MDLEQARQETMAFARKERLKVESLPGIPPESPVKKKPAGPVAEDKQRREPTQKAQKEPPRSFRLTATELKAMREDTLKKILEFISAEAGIQVMALPDGGELRLQTVEKRDPTTWDRGGGKAPKHRDWWTAKEVAKYLGLRHETFRSWLRRERTYTGPPYTKPQNWYQFNPEEVKVWARTYGYPRISHKNK